MKKITLLFDLTDSNEKNLIEELNNYISKYNEQVKIIFKGKIKKNIKMDEAQALKKYIESKGEPKIIEDIIEILEKEEELFYSYAYQAHCKKTGVEIGKYDFFRNELHKYKDGELKKMILFLLNQNVTNEDNSK